MSPRNPKTSTVPDLVALFIALGLDQYQARLRNEQKRLNRATLEMFDVCEELKARAGGPAVGLAFVVQPSKFAGPADGGEVDAGRSSRGGEAALARDRGLEGISAGGGCRNVVVGPQAGDFPAHLTFGGERRKAIKMQSRLVRPMNSLLFVSDRNGGIVPEWADKQILWTPPCISVAWCPREAIDSLDNLVVIPRMKHWEINQ